jgi:putative membrane protein
MNTQQFPMPFPRGDGGRILVEPAGGGGWPDGLSWVIFAVLLVLLLLAIVSLALDAYYRSQGGGARSGALAELDLRYARGEIGRDEYLQRRADLGGPAAPAPVEEKTATTRVQRPKTQPT